MKRLSLLFGCYLLILIAAAQEISRQEADSMLAALNKAKTDTDRMELLLSLAQFHIFKRGENKIDLDSAAACINEAKVLLSKANSSSSYGYLLMIESCLIKERGEKWGGSSHLPSDTSKKMAENAVKILESGTNKDYLGEAYYELSTYYNYDDSLHWLKKINLLRQSVDAFQQAGDFKRKGRSLQMLGDWYGDWYNKWYQPDKSIQVLQEALATYNSINYQQTQGIYAVLGRVYLTQHDYPSSLSNLLKALKAAQSTKDSSLQLGEIYSYIGLLYNNIDRWDMAVKYFNDALTIARKYNNENDISVLTLDLSSAYNNLKLPEQSLKVLNYIPKKIRLSENPVDVDKTFINMAYLRTYIGLKQPDNARPYCEVILSMVDKNLGGNASSYELMTRIYMYAASFYFLSNQYAKARYYVAKSNALANKMNYDLAQVHNLELLYKLDSAQGNFRSAFDHLIQYKQKTDSVSSERKARQFQVMNVEYEVGMKDDSIKLKDKDISLLSQRNGLQQANLKRASLIRNITVGGIILALLGIGLLYRQYRQKQKTNHLLQSQKEEINKNNLELHQLNEQQTKLLVEKDWLVKEIHHRVKNNLQMVVSLLNAQTEFLTHPSAIDAIKESRERMQAIAIIHQKLYQLNDSTQINIRSYINELIENIQHSFADTEGIYFKTDLPDVSLDISQAVPLGLILNEAITNAIKYAYPGNKKGSIQISLKHYDTDKLQLKVADNGKGLPVDVDTKHSNSLGMQLITLFAEQLDGDIYFINDNGLAIILNFPLARVSG